ncbi:MAG: HAD-IIA family hydrolase [Acidimicrobiia bacterium]
MVAETRPGAVTAPGNVVCDLDGVVYLGEEPVPGAAASLVRLERAGYRLLFVTNNASRTPEATAAKIAQVVGYPALAGQVLTSAQAAAHLLAGDRPTSFVLGGEGVSAALHEAGIPVTADWREAEVVVVGLAMRLNYDWLRDAVLAVRAGARLIATNLDPTFPTPEGAWPGAGSIVAAVERATSATALPAGKPYQPMIDLIANRLGPGPVWMVGDRADTDLALAVQAGWRPVLALSGLTRDPSEVPERWRPELVVASLADLPEALALEV